MQDNWEDRGSYWISKYRQNIPEWLSLRASLKATASRFGCLDQTYVEPDEDHREFMRYGQQTEHQAREYYSRTRNVWIREIGLAIPKWNTQIGASLDGEIIGTDGMIEIKCPLRMYRPLVSSEPHKQDENERPYLWIWTKHFDQMQGCMAICEKKWCDYIVFVPVDNKVYVERIPFFPDYWTRILYPKILEHCSKI